MSIVNTRVSIVNRVATTLTHRVIVKSSVQLAGTLSSSVEYFLDGIIDMGVISIEVPSGGLSLAGYSFDLSGLTSSEDNYTMFTSPVGGSGNILGKDYLITTSGTNSQVYDIFSVTGFEAFEFARVNYIDCTSLGEIDNYRQGLEIGTGRFGGSPSLTLTGAWAGGYRITTSIVRSMDDTTTEPLFKAGTGFVMQSRFLTDINCDLGTLQPFADFSEANFPNPSTVQFTGTIFTRDGVSEASDANIMPNLSNASIASDWSFNNGIANTYEGGKLTITTEVTTTINTVEVFETLAGTWNPTLLQHFDEPVNGQLRHLGNNPREFKIITHFIVEGPQNGDVTIRLRKYDASATTTSTVQSQSRQINALVGGRDVAFFDDDSIVDLDQNDYVFYEIANNGSTANLSVELDSFFLIETR